MVLRKVALTPPPPCSCLLAPARALARDALARTIGGHVLLIRRLVALRACVRACVRAGVRACVRACVRVEASVQVPMMR